MMALRTHTPHPAARGFTLVELCMALALVGMMFVCIMLFMNVIAMGMYSESIESDTQTRGAGRMFDILNEVRQASAQSPHFAVTGSTTTIPPSISFDLPASTSSTGAVVWGSKITYSLVANTGEFIDPQNTIQDAFIQRDEVQPDGTLVTTVIENHVPYKITENNGVHWGFTVSVQSNAVTVSIRRSGDTNTTLGTTAQTTGSTQGTIATSIFSGTYYLRNSQVAVPTTN